MKIAMIGPGHVVNLDFWWLMMKTKNQEAVIRARAWVRKLAMPPEAVSADKPKGKITLEPWSVICDYVE